MSMMRGNRRGFLSAAALARAAHVFPGRERAALAKAAPIPQGPFEPTWDSVRTHYQTPGWFNQAKFGIFIHRGLYGIPAYPKPEGLAVKLPADGRGSAPYVLKVAGVV